MNRLTRADSTDGLRRELRDVHHALHHLAEQLDSVQRQTQQLAALRIGDRDAADRMARLEHILDLNRVGTQVGAALRRTALFEAPVPHAVITDVLPMDVYDAAVEAIPARIFFDPRDGERELPVPPTLAPTHSIATWMFLADAVKDILVPALVDRFEEPLARYGDVRFTVLRGRLLRRYPGAGLRSNPGGPWDWLTLVLYLARAGDGDEFGSVIERSDAARAIPFRANTALMFFGSDAVHEFASIPESAPAATERYACEFRIGPDKKTRRRLQE